MRSVQTRFLHTESFRLSAIFAAFFFASTLALGALVYVMMGDAFQDEVLQFCDHDLAAIARGYSTEGLSEAVEIINQRMAAPGGSDFFLLQKGKSGRLAGNLSAMPPRIGVLHLPYPHIAGAQGEGHAILGRGAYLAPGLFVFVGRDLYFANRTKARIFHALLWILAATLLLAVLGGTMLSRSFLGGMDTIAKTCRAIMAGNFGNRIPTRGTRDELDRLAGAINEMLDRIADLMENLRQVSNDIAHDLRTPLTPVAPSARAGAGEREDAAGIFAGRRRRHRGVRQAACDLLGPLAHRPDRERRAALRFRDDRSVRAAQGACGDLSPRVGGQRTSVRRGAGREREDRRRPRICSCSSSQTSWRTRSITRLRGRGSRSR